MGLDVIKWNVMNIPGCVMEVLGSSWWKWVEREDQVTLAQPSIRKCVAKH
jgi:hypothetical protein